MMQKDKSYRIIGMMSGTSLDGIDLAFCHFRYNNQWQYELIAAKTFSYTQQIISIISSLQNEATSFLHFKKMEIRYSEFLSQTIQQFIQEQSLQHIDYVSLHGHTIFHQPQEKITVQIANLSAIAAHLKLNVIGNFREFDVMCGGQAAPLVPYGYQLFGDNIFLNFGGIANIGYKNSGWDINYCNLMLNHYASILQDAQFDRDGVIGRKGNVNLVLKKYLSGNWRNTSLHSLGREGFQAMLAAIDQHFPFLCKQDILHTFYVFLAQQINRNVELLIGNNSIEAHSLNVLCSGGGAKNIFLLELLNNIGKDRVKYILSEGKIVDFKEAIIFAYLGLKFIENLQNCKNGIGGMLAKGKP